MYKPRNDIMHYSDMAVEPVASAPVSAAAVVAAVVPGTWSPIKLGCCLAILLVHCPPAYPPDAATTRWCTFSDVG